MASDRSMVNKFVVDSARFWVEEYHLGGYRFDLMGLLDNKTMIDVYKECSSVYDKVMVYGEPWTGGTSKLKNGTDSNNLKNQQTVQASLGQSYFADEGNYVGAFNDQIRNAVRGDNAPGRGWVNGSTGSYGAIYAGVQGLFSTVNKEAENVEPQQVLNYVSCHDNYTLYDQLASNRIDSNDFNRTYKQAETMIFTAQGVPFLQEGEDFMRTKVNKRGTSGKYDHNSYNACDLTNHMDWSLKADNVEMFEYFKDLIAFRKATPELTISTRDEITAAYSKTGDGKTIAYKFDLTSKEGNCIYVVHASEAVAHELDGTYEVVFSNTGRTGNITSLDMVSNESVILKKVG
jgi:pullulanase